MAFELQRVPPASGGKTTHGRHRSHSLTWTGGLLGFSLGGFFDGILLHQILQWHHLLSNVRGLEDLRTQVLADGMFHALMYVIAMVALGRLWRWRAVFSKPGAGAMLWGSVWIGFGLWHVVDAVLSHWIIGIHRIRDDAANPLLWDVLWLLAFGVLPLLAGLWLRRKARGDDGGGDEGTGGSQGRTAALALGLATMLAGLIAAMPARDAGPVMVMFAPGMSGSAAFNALGRLDARVLWSDRSGGLWAVTLDDPGRAWQLYLRGAVMVSASTAGLGCFSWSRPPASQMAAGPAGG